MTTIEAIWATREGEEEAEFEQAALVLLPMELRRLEVISVLPPSTVSAMMQGEVEEAEEAEEEEQ